MGSSDPNHVYDGATLELPLTFVSKDQVPSASSGRNYRDNAVDEVDPVVLVPSPEWIATRLSRFAERDKGVRLWLEHLMLKFHEEIEPEISGLDSWIREPLSQDWTSTAESVIRRYEQIVSEPGLRPAQIIRVYGQTVRQEGSETLILMGIGGELAYEFVPSGKLATVGIEESPSQCFVIYREANSDPVDWCFVPAIETPRCSPEEFQQQVDDLRAAEIPLSKYKAPSY